MKTRFALTLMALLPILVACKAQDGSADTTAPAAPAPTSAPVSEAPAADSAPATDADTTESATETAGEDAAAATEAAPQAAAPVPAPARPVGPEPVAGTDYVVIEGGQPFQPAAGKIEVAEIFGYVCPACARFQPLVGSWKAGLPSDVNFVYVPALFGGTWDDYARAFYAAEALGLQDKTHDALYAAIHVEQTLKGERGRDSVQDIAGFFAKHGADPKQFADTMASFSVSAKTNRAKQFATRSKISGTPSLIVNGKYLVKGRSFEDMLRIADHLIASERAANAR
ncbi:thiol:disulfide interchange protein DsbA/DsbL [Flavobacterium sp. MXW15]|uniref:Thiol:disulfide interchange protein DsbA n=1 Tax=Xanthomonas chitinilytica TaxID=2989819 RepID=A0ABT3JSY0_9XANT|nr:thiol:disulfide interchange protein DsbA/DsbL [Xanthomonas sp. H13-6]MCW4455598.1 thiol:disulfide interchange protein DsbA/DsbL [Flavobacterium sp. MXW15]MCW4471596.1 thiol:disulfide interchange protein DsbA/DsbL [Xanthomonas sp. H13-6]